MNPLSKSTIAALFIALSLASSAPFALGQTCITPPSGLVGWWSGDGTTNDVLGGSNGRLIGNATYVAGKVNQAFSFDGNGDAVDVGNPASLQLQDFTIETWVKRANTNMATFNTGWGGVMFGYCDTAGGGYAFVLQDDGRLTLSKVGDSGVFSTARILDTNFHHVAVTKTNDVVKFYIDGVGETAPAYNPGFTFASTCAIGARGTDYLGCFLGSLDEMAVFNRALTSAEIQSIYGASAAGKCNTQSPTITLQPQSQTSAVGANILLTVSVIGAAPFSYQWQKDGGDISGATNSAYSIQNAQTNDSGTYSVFVTNSYGSVLSSNAALTVVELPIAMSDDFEPGVDVEKWSAFGGTVLATNYGGYVSTSNSLWFGGNGSRFATTRLLNTTAGGVVSFYLRLASGLSSTWETVDLPGEGVVLEYSINRGTNWVNIATYDTSAFTNWTFRQINMPAGAQANSTLFRWRQLSNSGSASDHWALDDVQITGPVAPSITTQPQSRTVLVGDSVTFSVNAFGSVPLFYQWQKDSGDILGATNSSYTLNNVSLLDSGSYHVIVTNALGSTTSSNGILTVSIPSCIAPPTNIVSWWSGDGNASDVVAGNHGTLVGNASYTNGKVNATFALDGAGDIVKVGNPTNLQLQNFTIEAWVKRNSASVVSADGGVSGHIFGYGSQGYVLLYQNDGTLMLNKVGVSTVSSSSFKVADTNWHHLAVTKTNTTVYFYLDGVAYASSPFAATFTFTTEAAIGGRADTVTGCFLGAIDELAIYNRALNGAEIQSIYTASTAGKCSAIAPAIVQQPLSKTAVVGQNATFSVNAAGSNPLSYQWLFNQTNSIAGATNSSLILTNIQLSQAGNYAVLVTNAFGSVSSSNAGLTVTLPPANLRILSTNGMSGTSITVPVMLAANGNENALGFSLNFPTQQLTYVTITLGNGAVGGTLLLNTSQTVAGKVGVAIALPSDTTFGAGLQEMVRVTFASVVTTNATNATVSFGDSPTLRQISDAQAGNLSATYTNGIITLSPSDLEGDVAPRPSGNRAVTITDWVQVGRFVARLDTPDAAEFQRIDCAPRANLGDGLIKVTDWVQAGRYAAGLDPATAVGGPTSDSTSLSRNFKGVQASIVGSREVRVSDATAVQQVPVSIPITLESQGDETAVGFSLSFDPSKFVYGGITAGADAVGATLNVNSYQILSGKVGVVLALQTGTSFNAGTREVAKVNLTPVSTSTGLVVIAFSDQPVPGSVSDANATELQSTYVASAVTINPLPQVAISHSGTNTIVAWPTWATGFTLESAVDLLSTNGWASAGGGQQTNGESVIMTVPASPNTRFFRLKHP